MRNTFHVRPREHSKVENVAEYAQSTNSRYDDPVSVELQLVNTALDVGPVVARRRGNRRVSRLLEHRRPRWRVIAHQISVALLLNILNGLQRRQSCVRRTHIVLYRHPLALWQRGGCWLVSRLMSTTEVLVCTSHAVSAFSGSRAMNTNCLIRVWLKWTPASHAMLKRYSYLPCSDDVEMDSRAAKHVRCLYCLTNPPFTSLNLPDMRGKQQSSWLER